jgi:hypothetical protein
MMKTLKQMTTIVLMLVLVGIAFSFMPAPVHAQIDGDVFVQVKVPGVLILRYRSTLVIDVSADDLAEVLNGAGVTNGLMDEGTSPDIPSWTGDAATPGGAGGALTATQTVTTAWKANALGGNGATISVALGTDVQLKVNPTDTGYIEITSVATRLNGTGTAGASVDIPSQGGFSDGEVQLGLDFSNISNTGTHENTNGYQYRITATAKP